MTSRYGQPDVLCVWRPVPLLSTPLRAAPRCARYNTRSYIENALLARSLARPPPAEPNPSPEIRRPIVQHLSVDETTRRLLRCDSCTVAVTWPMSGTSWSAPGGSSVIVSSSSSSSPSTVSFSAATVDDGKSAGDDAKRHRQRRSCCCNFAADAWNGTTSSTRGRRAVAYRVASEGMAR